MFHFLVGMLHVFVCFALIFFVLIQSGKGMGLSGAFGAAGGSESIFASSGGVNILVKITVVLALIFACTSLALSFVPPSNPSGGIMANQQGQFGESGGRLSEITQGGQAGPADAQPAPGGAQSQQQAPVSGQQPGSQQSAPPAGQQEAARSSPN